MAKTFTFVVRDVLRVIDGDSFELVLDLGFDTWRKAAVRLNGTDAPENHTATKDASVIVSAAVRKWFAARAGQLTLISFDWDKFGRVLGDVVCHSSNPTLDKQTLSEFLLTERLVRPYKGEAKIPWTEAQLAHIRAYVV